MRVARRILPLVVVTALTSGCYHQVVRTGATPGATVVERPWTATYLFGLVPATAIDTAAECPAGVAVVETQQTWVNGLVGALTLGIYTPQTVTITCAAAGAELGLDLRIEIPADAGGMERRNAVREAIAAARRTGERVVVASEK